MAWREAPVDDGARGDPLTSDGSARSPLGLDHPPSGIAGMGFPAESREVIGLLRRCYPAW